MICRTINNANNNAGLKTREQNEEKESLHTMQGNKHN